MSNIGTAQASLIGLFIESKYRIEMADFTIPDKNIQFKIDGDKMKVSIDDTVQNDLLLRQGGTMKFLKVAAAAAADNKFKVTIAQQSDSFDTSDYEYEAYQLDLASGSPALVNNVAIGIAAVKRMYVEDGEVKQASDPWSRLPALIGTEDFRFIPGSKQHDNHLFNLLETISTGHHVILSYFEEDYTSGDLSGDGDFRVWVRRRSGTGDEDLLNECAATLSWRNE